MDGPGHPTAAPAPGFVDSFHAQTFVKPEPSPQQLGSYEPRSIDGFVTSAPANGDIKPGLLGSPEYAEMQRLSQDYTPDLTGPIVGNLKPSKALAVEYANADPTYVKKTTGLVHKYDSYRTIRGDGNCGWRAVAYGFFELLLRTGDQNRIGMEHARIRSLSGLMDAVGMQSYIYEDFAEETYNVFRALSSSDINPADDSILVNTFNNQGISDAIVTHFKFLTSAWMKTNPQLYQQFLTQPVAEYCSSQIEPYGVEIDHVGIMGLINCIVLPAGFAIDIIYLDRSAGDEPTVHRFKKLEGEGVLTPHDAPVLRLLYRPGHYDIVYKVEAPPVTVPVFASIPPPEPVQVSFISALPEQAFMPTPAATPGVQYDFFAPYDMYETHHQASSPEPGNFRQSVLSIPEFQPSPFQPLPFQTTTFRNSPFNPSHFQSENFQPEIYQPPTPTSPTNKKHDRHHSDSL